MKKSVWVVLLLMATACSTPKKMFETGQYQQALETAAARIEKKCCQTDDLHFLNQSYHAANQVDYDKIIALKASGQPDIWPEVYHRTKAMRQRQDIILTLPEEAREAIRFQQVDFETEEAAARQKASMYLFTLADELMQVETPENAREAFRALETLKQIDGSFPEIDQLMIRALVVGAHEISFELVNSSGKRLPVDFAKTTTTSFVEKSKLPTAKLDVAPKKEKAYDLSIILRITDFDISPEKTASTAYTETLPKAGEDAVAQVKELSLEKTVSLDARLDFVRFKGNKAVLSVPLDIHTGFKHNFAVIRGDELASSERSRMLARQGPRPFPSDIAMLLQAARDLGNTSGALIVDEMNEKE